MTDRHHTAPDERDAALDAAWRAYSVETPPPALDTAILAAAHREARSRPRPAGDDDTLAEAREPSKWWWGLAAAATIGAIAFGLVQIVPPTAPTEPTLATDMPATASKRPAETAAVRKLEPDAPAADTPSVNGSTVAPTVPKASAEAGGAMRGSETTPTPTEKLTPKPPDPGSEPAPTPNEMTAPTPNEMTALTPKERMPRAFPAAPAPAAQEKSEEERKRALTSEAATAAGRAAPPPSAPAAAPAAGGAPATPSGLAAGARRQSEAARDLQGDDGRRLDAPAATDAGRAVAQVPAAAYVARIEAHLAAGRGDDAVRELRAFRAAYPDADERLPPALRPWAAGVPRVPAPAR